MRWRALYREEEEEEEKEEEGLEEEEEGLFKGNAVKSSTGLQYLVTVSAVYYNLVPAICSDSCVCWPFTGPKTSMQDLIAA